jgi:ubiquitin C-terminal hydrolase
VQALKELPKQLDDVEGLAAAAIAPQCCSRTSTTFQEAALTLAPIDHLVVVVAVVEKLRQGRTVS